MYKWKVVGASKYLISNDFNYDSPRISQPGMSQIFIHIPQQLHNTHKPLSACCLKKRIFLQMSTQQYNVSEND